MLLTGACRQEQHHLCVARRWPVPLATLFNGEPVGDETGGGHVMTVNGDYLRGTSGGPKRSRRVDRSASVGGNPIRRAASWALPFDRKFFCGASMLLRATSSDGADHQGVASKSRWRSLPALARWRDGQGCLFRENREPGPDGGSSRNHA